MRETKLHFLILFGVFGALPLFQPGAYILHVLGAGFVWAILAMSWNLSAGYAGLKTFGHHAFLGIGAYGSAIVAMQFGISPWISIWVGALLASVFSLVVAIPVLRLRSIPQTAIMTLAFGEIVRLVLANSRGLTNGEMGLFGIPAFDALHLPGIGQVTFTPGDQLAVYYLCLAFLSVVFLCVWALVRSRFGLAVMAVRDGEVAAESLGVNLALFKVLVFAISSFLAGLGGAVYAHTTLLITPESTVGFGVMILIMAMTLIGGLGTIVGPILGAILISLMGEMLRELGEWHLLIYGMLILVVVRLAPGGVVALLPGRFLSGQSTTR